MITLTIIGIIISIYGIQDVYKNSKKENMGYNPFTASNPIAFGGSCIIPFYFFIYICFLILKFLP